MLKHLVISTTIATPPSTLTVVCTPDIIVKNTKFSFGDTQGTTAVASGGSGSYTYAWVQVSGFENLTINSPSTAATSFHWTDLEALDETSANFKCTATDTLGNSGYQIISVSVVRSDFE